jgi:SMC interacting uncharacterized protein involved in chromosome segregation
VDKNITAVRGI